MADEKILYYTVGYHVNSADERIVVGLVVSDEEGDYIWALNPNIKRATIISELTAKTLAEMTTSILINEIDATIDRCGVNPGIWMPEIQGYASCIQFRDAMPVVGASLLSALEKLKKNFFRE